MTPHGDATGFLIAGYGLTWAALLLYAWRVERRVDDARRALDDDARQALDDDARQALDDDARRGLDGREEG